MRVFITSYKPVEGPREKLYYVYLIDVVNNGRTHRIERRYSSFLCLHKQLRKVHQTPEFPPKKVIHNTTRVLEQRRAALEAYLQALLIEPVPRLVLDFLEVPAHPSLTESADAEICHQPLLHFPQDSFLFNTGRIGGGTPDIIIRGTLSGLYGYWPV